MAGVYTVAQVNAYIKNMFARDFALSRIGVKGEVSNCKYHSSGHIYFTLKDRDAAISCVMFARERQGLAFRMQDGQQVEAFGQISVYEKSGSYQLYVRTLRLSGAGELYERFLKLKNELEEMGMFDPAYKKPIPAYCRRIGIVTAPTGAAIQDIINVSTRRNPYVELILYPALVQGAGAKESIVKGIRRLDRMGLDVIIVGRGGGSIEDLWAFNEEIVAKAIFDANTPIISAVGHETDYTIADFVSDRRAPTPSAAAEIANFVYEELEQETDAYAQSLKNALMNKLRFTKQRLATLNERLRRQEPERVLNEKRRRLSEIRIRMKQAEERTRERALERLKSRKEALGRTMERKLSGSRQDLKLYAARLDSISPLKRMSGGYGYLTDENSRAVTTVRQLKEGSRITAYVCDGKIVSSVEFTEASDIGNINGRKKDEYTTE